MRIIAGRNRSRVLKTLPGDNTRPTLDKVKEAVFSSLGSNFNGGNVLDLFSGSGAIGLEALSRGMDYAVFNDMNNEAVKIIKENIKMLKEEKVKVYNNDYKQVLEFLTNDKINFDLIYLDPPYKLKCIPEIINFIEQNNLLNIEGRIVVESLKEDIFDDYGNIFKYKEATYGITRISYFKRRSL